MQKKNHYPVFRKIAFYEGISYLVLLGIAMPLKYLADIPMAVTIVGGLHGALFIGFMLWMYLVYDTHGKGIMWMAKAFVASIVPFGTFYMDKIWAKESIEHNAKR